MVLRNFEFWTVNNFLLKWSQWFCSAKVFYIVFTSLFEMADSVLKFLGLKWEETVECRLSVGNAVAEAEYKTGHFSIAIDAQNLMVVVKNSTGRVVWQCKLYDL
jgi:hypothetical protein